MTCPVCRGTGDDPAGWPDTVQRPTPEAVWRCWCCAGSGELPEGAQWDPDCGKLSRLRRIAARITLRAQARNLGITMARLSEQERGLWRR